MVCCIRTAVLLDAVRSYWTNRTVATRVRFGKLGRPRGLPASWVTSFESKRTPNFVPCQPLSPFDGARRFRLMSANAWCAGWRYDITLRRFTRLQVQPGSSENDSISIKDFLAYRGTARALIHLHKRVTSKRISFFLSLHSFAFPIRYIQPFSYFWPRMPEETQEPCHLCGKKPTWKTKLVEGNLMLCELHTFSSKWGREDEQEVEVTLPMVEGYLTSKAGHRMTQKLAEEKREQQNHSNRSLAHHSRRRQDIRVAQAFSRSVFVPEARHVLLIFLGAHSQLSVAPRILRVGFAVLTRILLRRAANYVRAFWLCVPLTSGAHIEHSGTGQSKTSAPTSKRKGHHKPDGGDEEEPSAESSKKIKQDGGSQNPPHNSLAHHSRRRQDRAQASRVSCYFPDSRQGKRAFVLG
ncbi:hypothetical protein T439DRAFT_371083 [Meredithblackwellia eburnea MCA 4105]